MHCLLKLITENHRLLGLLPFDPRKEFALPRGPIYVHCTLNKISFVSRLLARGGSTYALIFPEPLRQVLALSPTKDLTVAAQLELWEESLIPPTESLSLQNQEVIQALSDQARSDGFSSKLISDTWLQQIIHAGKSAPIPLGHPGFQMQILSQETTQKIWQLSPWPLSLKKAPHHILVAENRPENNGGALFSKDSSAIAQNLLLTAAALGLRGLWYPLKDGGEQRKNLSNAQISLENTWPLALLALGYPKANTSPAKSTPRKKPPQK